MPAAKSTSSASKPTKAVSAPANAGAPTKAAAKPPTAGAAPAPPSAAKPSKTKAAPRTAPRRDIDEWDDAEFDALNALPDDVFLGEQRDLLLYERDIYANQSARLRAEADELAADMEPGDVQFDDESGEGGTMSMERERDLAMSASAALMVEEIERSIDRIDRGTYGVCEQSGKPIPRARLRAIPWATLTVESKNGGLSRR